MGNSRTFGSTESQTNGGNTTYFLDQDNDGFGNPAVSQQASSQPSGYVLDNTDCNDDNSAINPSATELTTIAMVRWMKG